MRWLNTPTLEWGRPGWWWWWWLIDVRWVELESNEGCWIRWQEIFEKFPSWTSKNYERRTKVNVELKLNCGYLLGVCYFGLPVEPRLIFSLPLLELLLKRLKRNAKIICDGILMDMRSTATGARRSFSQESEAFSLKMLKS